MRVLLLGADGFIGRHVAERLLADPAVQLTALGRSDDADVRFDLSEGAPGVLARFLDAVHPGVVINCAGTTRGGARELTRHNTVAVATVCEAMRRSGASARLVQLGCASEYGPSPAGSSTPEDAVPRPGGPYGVSKLAGSELVLGSGLDAVVLRVFSPIGPGTPAASPLGRLADALRRAMQAGEGELRLAGMSMRRDFVDVRDVARAVHAASLSAAQGVVNIGTGNAVHMREVANALAHIAGFGGALHELDDPQQNPPQQHPHSQAHPPHSQGLPPHSQAHPYSQAHPPYSQQHPYSQVPHSQGNPHPQTHPHPQAGQPPAAPVPAPAQQPPHPDGCGPWQQADVRTARDRLGWRPRIALDESLADIWMEAACRV